MARKPLKHTAYREQQSPNNIRSGSPTRAETALDAESYHQPLAEFLGNLHGAGIVSGLKVTATENAPGLLVSPGEALDASGRAIVLAVGGRAEIGASADAAGTAPQLVEVKDEGVLVPTTGHTGNRVLLIRWWETFDRDAFYDTGTHRMEHTPWIQIVEPAPSFFTDPLTRIPLCSMELGAGADAGKVKWVAAFRAPIATLGQGIEFRAGQRKSLVVDDTVVAGLSQAFGGIQLSAFSEGRERQISLHPEGDEWRLVANNNSLLMEGWQIKAGYLTLKAGLVVEGLAHFSGGKVGFVTDAFRNATGARLERGELVVIGPHGPRSNSAPDIPVPDVEAAVTEYDTRLCGVVSDAAAPGEKGQMVTLGCFAHCKVDADRAPILAGDLLTSSETPGHARKVTDRAAAVGAILGKALSPLASGKGIIPVLVLMQ